MTNAARRRAQCDPLWVAAVSSRRVDRLTDVDLITDTVHNAPCAPRDLGSLPSFPAGLAYRSLIGLLGPTCSAQKRPHYTPKTAVELQSASHSSMSHYRATLSFRGVVGCSGSTPLSVTTLSPWYLLKHAGNEGSSLGVSEPEKAWSAATVHPTTLRRLPLLLCSDVTCLAFASPGHEHDLMPTTAPRLVPTLDLVRRA